MDGKVLSQVIEEDYFQKNAVSYSDRDEGDRPDSDSSDAFMEDEADSVMERLKGLGYMD
jgi:hypothetical protein